MSRNKDTVSRYMDAYGRSDHAAVLDCLTADVEWVVPGAFRLKGKDAFEREMNNPAFSGKQTLSVSRLIEESNVVVAEGHVESAMRDGTPVALDFCDIFEMRDGRIARLISYLVPITAR